MVLSNAAAPSENEKDAYQIKHSCRSGPNEYWSSPRPDRIRSSMVSQRITRAKVLAEGQGTDACGNGDSHALWWKSVAQESGHVAVAVTVAVVSRP